MKNDSLDNLSTEKLEKLRLNKIKSIAISASAGSGKTYALTTRLLLFLIGGAPINEILAITFTNKAAGEIKDRLLKRLRKIINHDNESIKELCDILEVTETELVKRTQKLYYELIRHFSSLKISTIDSFFTSILKQFPSDIGTALDIKIIDDNEKTVVFNEALEEFYRKLNSNEKLLDMAFEYIQSRNKPSFKTKHHFDKLYDNFNPHYFKLRGSEITKPELLEEAEKRLNDILYDTKNDEFEKLINDTIKSLSEYISANNNINHKNLKGFCNKLRSFFPLKDIKLLEDLGVFQKNDPGDMNYIKKISEVSPDLWENIINNLRKIKKTITDYVKAKIDYQFYKELEIYLTIREIYSRIKEEKNILDFQDIEELTYNFLINLNEFDYFNYRIDTPIKYILIDEFQDTSELQWNAIKPIVDNAIRADGTLIYVGDIKQSIYQWRGGNPKLFKKIKEIYSLDEEKLKINYRSAPLILDFINNIFKDISNKFPDFEYDIQHLPPKAENISKSYGYVHVIPVKNPGKKISEAALEIASNAVVEEIKRLNQHGINYSDLAVLCERNDQIAELEKLLKMNDIPFVGSGKRLLLEDYAVMDIINFLKFLTDPLEKIYFVAILRSPIFRVKYKLLQKIKDNEGELSLSILKKYEPEIYNTLERLLTGTRYLSISKLLLKLFEELSIFDVYPESKNAILDLYELSYNFERESSNTSILDFIEYLEKAGSNITSNTSSINGVQFSTIHSAKGLEYHTVIVPYLISPEKHKKDKLYHFKESKNKITGFIKLSNEYETFYPDIDFQEEKSRIERDYLIEKLNLMYVSFSRAINNLIIMPIIDKSTIGNLFLKSLYPTMDFEGDPPGEYEIGKIVPSKKEEKSLEIWEKGISLKELNIEKTTINLVPKQFEYDNSADSNIFNRRLSILKGLTVHRVLSYIRDIPISNELLDNLIKRALSFEGKNFTKLEKQKVISSVETMVKTVITDERIKRFFSRDSYSEVSTLGKEYQNLIGRIDRILINEGSIEIIDFKTDHIKDIDDIKRLVSIYNNQIDSYCKTIKEIYPEREVKGYIYFIDAPFKQRLQTIEQ